MHLKSGLKLQSFYPPKLEVANIFQTDSKIHVKMFTRLKNCTCLKCGAFQRTGMEHMKIS